MTPVVPFAALKAFLIGLGCRYHEAPEDYSAFKHPQSGALIILRHHKDDEAVSPTDLAIARRILDEFGVLPRGDFDSALKERVLAG